MNARRRRWPRPWAASPWHKVLDSDAGRPGADGTDIPQGDTTADGLSGNLESGSITVPLALEHVDPFAVYELAGRLDSGQPSAGRRRGDRAAARGRSTRPDPPDRQPDLPAGASVRDRPGSELAAGSRGRAQGEGGQLRAPEGFAGGELKHGVIALIERGTPCLVLAKARGAMIIGVSPEPHEAFDAHIPVADLGPAAAIVNAAPAQLLGYYLALLRGHDPDKPRNLAKSVTVK